MPPNDEPFSPVSLPDAPDASAPPAEPTPSPQAPAPPPRGPARSAPPLALPPSPMTALLRGALCCGALLWKANHGQLDWVKILPVDESFETLVAGAMQSAVELRTYIGRARPGPVVRGAAGQKETA